MNLVKTTLGELSIGKGQYGIGASAVDYSEDKHTYLRITDIKDDGTLNIDDLKSVDDPDAEKYILEPNDIVFARTGASTGRNYFYDGSDGELVYAGFLIKFSINPDKVNPRFIKYYCLSDIYKGWVIGHTNGSTRGNINAKGFAELEILLPPREQQDRLVSILDDIEKKRKNNDAINRNLSEQIQLLYSEFFEGEKSEEWEAVPLSNLIFFQEGPGIRNWQYVEKDGTKFINIRCINNGDIDVSTANMISNEEAEGKYAHFMLKPYDIVMSCSGTLGRYAIVREEHLPLCLNTSVIRFFPAVTSDDFSYVYGYMTSKEFLNRQREMACGSVQANFGPTHLKKMEIHEPPIELRKEYHKVVFPLIEHMICLRRENDRLAKTRDTLLPKLMSGELDVSDFEI